ADPEPVAIAKLLAPRATRSQPQRAIVAADYDALARRESPGLQAASAVLRWTGSWYEVLVSADERGRADPDPSVLGALAGRLERFRRMGHDVVVAPARSVPLTITLSVCVAAHHRRSDVAAALGDVFSSRAPGGMFHPDRLVPGGPIASSVITAAAQSIDGVESVEVTGLRRLFGPSTVPVPVDGVLRFGPTEVARVDSNPLDPDLGSIGFVMRGGR
ncbi:MAG: putative baseplate assembly protein, partial [Ilumatobacteraceae bacterium]